MPANGWVSATATNEFTGDTSEFSGGITAQPVNVEFEMMKFAVDSSAGVAIIVERMGNVNATVSVQYATSNGTAIAGKQYVPASGTLTFLPGQLSETFRFTILPQPESVGGDDDGELGAEPAHRWGDTRRRSARRSCRSRKCPCRPRLRLLRLPLRPLRRQSLPSK